ncbi:hypothetical protein H6B30_02270 [Marseilla massiliensis]|uniref:Peptide zinc metalloprotease protein n=2 Tax=Marseilla massiliensis TaxID=1841864 RepID=A0A938WLZ1_9BACT|nr:hypothetical protein [Marseilla massiliensis]
MNLKDITIQPFPTSSRHETYLMEASGRFFEISKDTAVLLTYLKENGLTDESISSYVASQGGKPSRDEVTAFIDGMAQKIRNQALVGDKRKSFLYSKDFITAEAAGKVSAALAWLFRPWVAIPAVAAFALADMVYFAMPSGTGNHVTISIYLLAGMYALMILSSLVHEFGHAAACRHFGAPHGNIGLGLYLNLPVFYTDVSHVWKLPRCERCVVNFGGIYFQMLLMLPLLGAAIITRNNLLHYLIVLMNLNFLITMNPFFKFDGYWMVTDLLGVANLRQKGMEWAAYSAKRLLGRAAGPRPYLHSLPLWARLSLIGYTVVVTAFFVFYFCYAIPMFFARFYKTFPDRFMQLLSELSRRQMPEWSNTQQIVLQLIFLFFFTYMLYRMALALARRLRWIK